MRSNISPPQNKPTPTHYFKTTTQFIPPTALTHLYTTGKTGLIMGHLRKEKVDPRHVQRILKCMLCWHQIWLSLSCKWNEQRRMFLWRALFWNTSHDSAIIGADIFFVHHRGFFHFSFIKSKISALLRLKCVYSS